MQLCVHTPDICIRLPEKFRKYLNPSTPWTREYAVPSKEQLVDRWTLLDQDLVHMLSTSTHEACSVACDGVFLYIQTTTLLARYGLGYNGAPRRQISSLKVCLVELIHIYVYVD
jgi:hypothetical protein